MKTASMLKAAALCLLICWAIGCSSKPDPIWGIWDGGDWGTVTLQNNTGSYTNTMGTGPGKMDIKNTNGRNYSGTWGESEQRHGTLQLTLSKDGNAVQGTWKADQNCTVNPGNEGTIQWKKKQ
jgi:hypothetical protein